MCKRCETRGQTWAGDAPTCAFDKHGNFTADNWNCATMNALREAARIIGTAYHDDDAAASIGTVPFESDDYSGYIVMTWYKNRGRTGNALIMWDDHEPRTLTEADAEAALRYGAAGRAGI